MNALLEVKGLNKRFGGLYAVSVRFHHKPFRM